MAVARGEPRPEKVAQVEEIQRALDEAVSTALVEMHGITVAEASELRDKFRERDVTFKVYKNTFISLAARNLGIEGLEPHLKGPTALAISLSEPSTAMKVLRDYIKGAGGEKIRVKAGLLGKATLSEADTAALADLPTRDEALGQLAGVLQAPVRGLAVALNQIIGGLAIALGQVVEQQGGSAE